MNRKIDELGRITIPKEMRATLGINPNDPVNISMEDDKIIITKPRTVNYKERIEEAIDRIEEHMKYHTGMNCGDMVDLIDILKGE